MSIPPVIVSSARKAGKFMLESELQRSGKSLKDYRGSTLKRVLDSIGVSSLNKLLTELGSGKRTGNIVAERFYSGLKYLMICGLLLDTNFYFL